MSDEPVAWILNGGFFPYVTTAKTMNAPDADAELMLSTGWEPLYLRSQSDELARLRAENERLRASMQAVIEEYDDSNPLAVVIEDMRVTLAQGKV